MRKIIRDLIHGYVEIDDSIEEIINTLHYQRLKDICQLTAQHVFPSATHNRFEHSLGVMYLSRKALNSLKPLLEEKYNIDKDMYDRLYWHLTFASLLHDVGHAPFSHLGERYYREEEIKKEISETIRAQKMQEPFSDDVFSEGTPHELMSCYIILKKYVEILSKLNNTGSSVDFELICRCILGNQYKSSHKWLENIIIGLLNSNTIDTDKLDYLMRDAYMTGVNVPLIDTTRLFRNIYINPITKEITFHHRSLPVIQSIIDSRDSLYLWVYNHHISVYTDFIVEFYIKHLIANYENKSKFVDKMDPNDFFSCNAICNGLVSDSNLKNKLKEPLPYILNNKGNISNYTKKIFPQLFERKFLKPLWKTIYEHKQFLENNIQDVTVREKLIDSLCRKDYAYRRYIVKILINECNLAHGDVFIVPRSNKFYFLNPESLFRVHIDDHDERIETLLPQKKFSDLYNDVSFYIFGPKEKLDQVKTKFIEVVNRLLPSKDGLSDNAVNLRWFKV
ncbi:MAG TPA: dGTP triphosphohydrolase [Candidatus Atribacteria bacterium]|nr:dGTP triphosphohydrolase [Candidatus Atribacteria bacterium]